MRMIGLALFSTLVGLALSAGQLGQGLVQGTVTAVGSSEPIAGVLVSLVDGTDLTAVTARDPAQMRGAKQTTTDSLGRFAFSSIPPGRYILRAERKGYLKPEIRLNTFAGGASPAEAATFLWRYVTVANQPVSVTLTLARSTTISGKVTDVDGMPLPRVPVEAFVVIYSDGQRVLTRYSDPTLSDGLSASDLLLPQSVAARRLNITNENGEYRITGLTSGEYYVRAQVLRLPPPGMDGQPFPTTTYYPNAPEFALASPIRVRGGDLGGFDIHVRSVPRRIISGTLRLAVPDPANMSRPVFFMVRRAPGTVVEPQVTAVNTATEEGRFELRCEAGQYTILTAMTNSLNKLFISGTDVDVRQKDAQNVSIVIVPPTEIRGTVTGDGGPLAKVSVVLKQLGAGLSLSVARGGYVGPRDQQAAAAPKTGLTDSAGRFAIEDVPDGDYRVMLTTGDPAAYVSDLRVGGVSVLDTGTVSVRGGKMDILHAVIRTDSAELSGFVRRSGNAASGANVLLVPDSSLAGNPALYRRTTADQQGRYDIKFIVPGQYVAVAITEPLPEGSELAPGFLTGFGPFSRRVRITNGQHISADLEPATRRD